MSPHLQIIRETFDADAYAQRDAEARVLRNTAQAQMYGEQLAKQRRRRRALAMLGIAIITTGIIGVILC